jgi:sugar/nucleoside kinase (ribokinase family)
VLVCTLGDALLDVVVRPERALVEGDDVPAEIRAGAGGQAANVAAWAVELGAQARVVAKRAEDTSAALVEAELRSRGVDVKGPVVPGRSGIVVSQVGPGGERSMLSDRGVCPGLRAEELELSWFRGCAVLHLSGYALLARPIDEAGAKAAGAVVAQGGRVSVDLAARTAIEAFGPERLLGRLADLAPDVVFAGERELGALGGDPPASTLVVKRGARGCTVVAEGESIHYQAVTADVVDTTGAGDAFAAGFLVGGPELALEVAARCVSKMGAMP